LRNFFSIFSPPCDWAGFPKNKQTKKREGTITNLTISGKSLLFIVRILSDKTPNKSNKNNYQFQVDCIGFN